MTAPAHRSPVAGSSVCFDQHVPRNGYAWWYVDALSDDGQHGITIIAFIGSVFSPYYAWARKKGPADPLNHCAINVAIYEKRRHYWAMTERPKGQVERNATKLAIGPSQVRWDGSALTIDIDEITAPIPSRIRGTIRVVPAMITEMEFLLNPDGRHRWWPIAPCSRVQVALGSPSLHWQGDGYFDMNAGDAPLEEGFTTWEWSRTAMRKGTAILYEAKRRGGGRVDLAFTVDPSGKMQTFQPPAASDLARTGWRVKRSAHSSPSRPAIVVTTLEDAPFYSRSVVSANLLGEDVIMMHESLSLDRFRKPIVQAMLPFRMPRTWR
ncbi:carotenoid 1,2-hydratase [Afipia sp. DC4300-2b1]|uniref:carotenoid 1,2-hydratase n=1 Tax=Afipia sp. DC4300-2b1 TaxID=2804672 RepID=UPI003CFAE658